MMDRGYAKFALIKRSVSARSSYVCRLRDNSVYETLESRTITDADRTVNVTSDEIVQLGLSGKPEARPDHKMRLITVRISPHTSRGRRGSKRSG